MLKSYIFIVYYQYNLKNIKIQHITMINLTTLLKKNIGKKVISIVKSNVHI